jgi:DNA-binding NarL/FixJ family response regulator
VRCLIIDDDESPRTLIERILSRAGHRTTTCSTPAEGLAAATASGFDVAIVDLEMPGMSGAITIGELRKIAPTIRVLVVSGYSDRKHVMAALDAGADGYILKDEISESLSGSLQDVRAGYTPLSPRVAALMLARLRQELSGKRDVKEVTLARLKPPA